MNLSPLFQRYELLVAKADQAFQELEKQFPECVTCEVHCSDCCHALFGLFMIETAYLQQHFTNIDRKERRAALLKCKKADQDLEKLEKKLQTLNGNQQVAGNYLARERIRCPLLDDNQECILYNHRPITCRVYGIPTEIQGTAHVCGKASFKSGKFYPTFDLDAVQKELYLLSKEFLGKISNVNPEKASLQISVSKAIKTPLEDIVNESYNNLE